MKIALLGCGTIGSCVAEELLSGRLPNIELKHILVNNLNKSRPIKDKYPDLFTNNIKDISEDSEIDIVIELMGVEEPALSYVLDCISAGKHLITANKELIAKHNPILSEYARMHKVEIRLEAAVGGGIPIISTLEGDLAANNITEIIGILNGTTNYMLTRMQEGCSYAEALEEATEKGYAEPDPTNDVEGYDVKYKTAILASLGFGQYVNPDDVPCVGISQLSQRDFEIAEELGYTVKLLGLTSRLNSGEISAEVHPYLIPLSHELASVHYVLNGVMVSGDLINQLLLVGPGAGPEPTTSAILGDVCHIAAGSTQAIKSDETLQRATINASDCKLYLRLIVDDQVGVIGTIGDMLASCDISLDSIIQKQFDGEMNLALLTHTITREQLEQMLNKMSELNAVKQVACKIKVL